MCKDARTVICAPLIFVFLWSLLLREELLVGHFFELDHLGGLGCSVRLDGGCAVFDSFRDDGDEVWMDAREDGDCQKVEQTGISHSRCPLLRQVLRRHREHEMF